MSLLQDILNQKRSELPALRRRVLPRGLSPRPIQLRRAETGRLGLICEIKFRSPSAGALSQAQSVEQRAGAYAQAGADMLSVLCDERFFAGDYSHLQRARGACEAPLLCKEFVIDDVQLDAAAAFGADAVLLIVRCLAPEQLARLIVGAQERGLLPLVEVHTQAEADLALGAGARCVGVNARDLDTLQMDVAGAQRVLATLPADVLRIHLSGIKSAADVAALCGTTVDAALIGEALMRQDDPTALLTELSAARKPT